jgi:hypothetical protein
VKRDLRPVPIDFTASQQADKPVVEERVRRWPLWVLGLIGAASVTTAWYLDTVYQMDNIVPSLFLELGAGTFLFAFLFWAERRIVRREVRKQTEALIEALTDSPSQLAQMADDPDLATLSARFADEGAIGTALRFVRAAAEGRYEDAWALTDENWKLCRAQAFLWNNRDHFSEDPAQLDKLAARIVRSTASELWKSFCMTERDQYLQLWGDIDISRWGAASRRRRIARDFEIVILSPLGEYANTGFIVKQLTALPGAIKLVMHHTDEGIKVATHVAEAPPTPGWPPAWWVTDDPAVEALGDS